MTLMSVIYRSQWSALLGPVANRLPLLHADCRPTFLKEAGQHRRAICL